MIWTLLSLLNWTTDYFTKNKISTPRLDAEVLLAHTLKLERLQLYLQFERSMTEEERTDFKALIQRRIKGEPVSYIRGMKEFWSLPFKVGPGVLVPRPETELLVEVAESLHPANILDIGTGSGNLAVAMAKKWPQAHITALDISGEALKYAQENAVINAVSSQIEFIQKDFLTLPPPRSPLYDLIVSNPPYISTPVWETLPAGIRDFEPQVALDGGPDGLAFYRKIGQTATPLLKEEGTVIVEMGEDQAEAVKKIFEKNGFKDIEVVNDYAGLPRVIVAKNRKHSNAK